MGSSFDELIAEAEAAPIDGWDFSWLDGRATEQRPSWRFSERVAERAKAAARMVDLQSGGGEMLANLPNLSTEGYAPNLLVAARLLRPRGAFVVEVEGGRPPSPALGAPGTHSPSDPNRRIAAPATESSQIVIRHSLYVAMTHPLVLIC